MKYKKLIIIALNGALAALFSGCGKSEDSPAETVDSASAQLGTAAGGPLLAERPAETVALAAALKGVPELGEVTVQGRVGGTREPITEGFAAFVLADEAIWFCDEGEEDHCPTPWDACCENPETVKALRVLVQFADEDGLPRRGDLLKQLGIGPNQTIAVTGQFVTDAQGNRLLNAREVWIAP